jgi:hypothetical protein
MYESDLFMSYFRKMGGIEYLPGGVESGFKQVEKKEFVPFEVDMKADSVNLGDVFILD